jgi:hypothetical protein
LNHKYKRNTIDLYYIRIKRNARSPPPKPVIPLIVNQKHSKRIKNPDSTSSNANYEERVYIQVKSQNKKGKEITILGDKSQKAPQIFNTSKFRKVLKSKIEKI